MKSVLFVIFLDKFTRGFYDFLISNFSEQDNWFLIYGPYHQFDFKVDETRTFWVDSFHSVNKSHKVVEIAKKSDMIIYSGVWGSERLVSKFGLRSLSKSFFHFWGDDFYMFRSINALPVKSKLMLYYKRFLIRHAYGVVTLVPKEYDELRKLCKPKGKHFVAPVSDNGEANTIITSLNNIEKCKSPIKILLGNSATETNQHIQALKILEKFKKEDIMIICPLSYGEDAYRDMVSDYGNKLFGNKFFPVFEFMKKDEYFSMISECTVAIYNNNRQQALGNINAALSLGCKVFIRKDTPMWDNYKNDRKMEVFDINSISNMSYDEFVSLSFTHTQNIRSSDSSRKNDEEIAAWRRVFDSIK